MSFSGPAALAGPGMPVPNARAERAASSRSWAQGLSLAHQCDAAVPRSAVPCTVLGTSPASPGFLRDGAMTARSLSNAFSPSRKGHVVFSCDRRIASLDRTAQPRAAPGVLRQSYLVVADDVFIMLLDVVCCCFVEDFHICVHKGCWSVVSS